ncbi:MAG: hypothetical protein QGG74_02830 [Phycisphaerales bacterium]|jgi:thiamine pyrophosphate-dependent acetolactate synthase large subunit-like protein|nr:hypothetical protein [Phycisphaerales bacterium]
MSRTPSDQRLDTLKSVGVRRIVGIPGDTINTLLESLPKDVAGDRIPVLAAHAKAEAIGL